MFFKFVLFSGGKQRTSVPWKPFNSSGKSAAVTRILVLRTGAQLRIGPEMLRMTQFWTFGTSKMEIMWRRACRLSHQSYVHLCRPHHQPLSSRKSLLQFWRRSSSMLLRPTSSLLLRPMSKRNLWRVVLALKICQSRLFGPLPVLSEVPRLRLRPLSLLFRRKIRR